MGFGAAAAWTGRGHGDLEGVRPPGPTGPARRGTRAAGDLARLPGSRGRPMRPPEIFAIDSGTPPHLETGASCSPHPGATPRRARDVGPARTSLPGVGGTGWAPALREAGAVPVGDGDRASLCHRMASRILQASWRAARRGPRRSPPRAWSGRGTPASDADTPCHRRVPRIPRPRPGSGPRRGAPEAGDARRAPPSGPPPRPVGGHPCDASGSS